MSNLALALFQPLAERYQPQTVSEFVGLEKPKRIMEKFCANPYPSAWLLVGPIWDWENFHGSGHLQREGHSA